MDIKVVVSQMLELFLILALGYIAAKKKVISPNFGSQLSNFILSITLPCMMLASVATMPKETNNKDVMVMFIISILFYLVMPFVAYFIARILMVKKADRHLYMYMTIWSNVGFMGFPVIASIFGEGAIFYATIFNLIFNVSNFTLGIMLMSKEGRSALDFKKFLSPGMMSSIVAVIMFSANIKLPVLLNDTLKTVGSTTTPLAMIVIGIALAGIAVKSVFTEFRLYPYVIIKQILLPLLAWGILKNVIVNPYLLGIITVIIAMPVATSAVLFANRYENDVALATKGVFITTLASVVTIPMISYLLL
ncbi:AEC family transporter [Acetobacterium sp.]|uniref:AEC family transporter n=1 Tax=Acetobacterium sp. TaxID=1872094 RepID=UPI000CC983AD|nr:AEC family transporter [Acetobacterium sp.]MDO9490641.1 AEC family transporter [Acetobacterium sp.]PKM75071.1 MAG: transporter [Firmicutes bacterium HGW-Firmicutes-17]